MTDHVYVHARIPRPPLRRRQERYRHRHYSSINTNAMEPYGETIFGSRGTMIVEMETERDALSRRSPRRRRPIHQGGNRQRWQEARRRRCGKPPGLCAAQATGPSGKISVVTPRKWNTSASAFAKTTSRAPRTAASIARRSRHGRRHHGSHLELGHENTASGSSSNPNGSIRKTPPFQKRILRFRRPEMGR